MNSPVDITLDKKKCVNFERDVVKGSFFNRSRRVHLDGRRFRGERCGWAAVGGAVARMLRAAAGQMWGDGCRRGSGWASPSLESRGNHTSLLLSSSGSFFHHPRTKAKLTVDRLCRLSRVTI